jgi:hypothetical protein
MLKYRVILQTFFYKKVFLYFKFYFFSVKKFNTHTFYHFIKSRIFLKILYLNLKFNILN